MLPSPEELPRLVQFIFSERGPLSKAERFEYRPQQQQMAVAVAETLLQGEHLIVEAGTGVGKSLAYLVPSILLAAVRKRQAIVSTKTINLQEQLIGKDLPMLQEFLETPFHYAMLKGRGNYLCTRRLDQALISSGSLFDDGELKELERIGQWARTTTDGSLSDLSPQPRSSVWERVCSEQGVCSPKLCGHQARNYREEDRICFFQRARQMVRDAQILVVNHTLFFILAGNGSLLNKQEFVIFDEAHELEAVALRNIGISVTQHQVHHALNRIHNPSTRKGLLFDPDASGGLTKRETESLTNRMTSLENTVDALFADIEENAGKREGEGESRWSELRIRQPLGLTNSLSLPFAELQDTLKRVAQSASDDILGQELRECTRKLRELGDAITDFLDQKDESLVYWVKRGGRKGTNISLHASPIGIGPWMNNRIFRTEEEESAESRTTSIVMTSATLAVPGNPRAGADPLDYFALQVGAPSGTRKLQLGSPFDYRSNMRVYISGNIPDPRQNGYQEAVEKWTAEALEANRGRTLVLFTSYRQMRATHEALRERMEKQGIPILIQGDGTPRTELLDRFRQDVSSVLFGTESFWQGVDVPGESLSCVVIPKLPFAVPSHPLVQARREKIEAEGGKPFFEQSLPEAILKFRQGVGRLIRTRSDRGTVLILDNRIRKMRYGRQFLDALPRCEIREV